MKPNSIIKWTVKFVESSNRSVCVAICTDPSSKAEIGVKIIVRDKERVS